MNEQTLIGVAVAVLCALGLWRDRWLLTETRKGRWLTDRLGETRALWILRVLLAAGATFGTLLAADVLRPIKW